MLSFNRVFGGGAPLRQRPIWTGNDRLFAGIVAAQVRPYKTTALSNPRMSPGSTAGITYNGTLYAILNGTSIMTTTDFVTGVQRYVTGPSYNRVWALTAAGSDLFACTENQSAPYTQSLNRSRDGGATWTIFDSVTTDLFSAGGLLYTSKFKVYDPATGAWAVSSWPAWGTTSMARIVKADGGPTLAIGDSSGYVVVSADGKVFTDAFATYAAAAAQISVVLNRLYTWRGKFLALGFMADFVLGAMESVDGRAWIRKAASPLQRSSGRDLVDLSRTGVEIDGVLYIGALLQEGTRYIPTLLSTADGDTWRLHADGPVLTSKPLHIEPIRRAGASSILLYTASIETDTDNGLELYYEL